jgi:hypothetical protein
MGADQITPGAPPSESHAVSKPEGTSLVESPQPAASRGAPVGRHPSTAARAALWIAIGADVAQILLVPVFVEGWFSPANDILDVLVACLMFGLLGWHPAFLPSFIAEMVPVLGLFPTWTVAVLFATRKRA